ncbi:hypothetical protein RHSIM_Rhsim10G0025100 [Rhododendron simsii]|uniref:Myb/SANT-like domain-containing protein n=1 Tax=Rhododendron simsii TaxID=118357 RepID=A0A834LDU0_RHOSS|nr:hypothetical protein RHSIM_Rhsim10G0025100 [Rhododendron simsii]
MLSPSRGRGRGIRTSPRKAFSQPSQQPYGQQHSQQPYFSQPSLQPYTKTIDRAKWTSPLIKSLLEACAEEIEENGRAVNGFSKQAWARIVNAVMGKTGKKFEKKQLKDKHNRLNDEWRAWILVAEDKRQTGLGTEVTSHGSMWSQLHVAQFRDRGLEQEGLIDRVFRDVTGMENEAIFPGEGIEEIAEGFGESDGMSLKHGGSFPQSQEQYQTPVGKGKDPTGQTSTVGRSYSSQKRKFFDAYDAMSASFAESVDRFKSQV